MPSELTDRERAAEFQRQAEELAAENRRLKAKLEPLENDAAERTATSRELARTMADPDLVESYRSSAWVKAGAPFDVAADDFVIPAAGWPPGIESPEKFIASERGFIDHTPSGAAATIKPAPFNPFIRGGKP